MGQKALQFGRSTPVYQYSLVAATAIVLAVSLVRPIYPHEQWLQHPPTVTALLGLAVAASRRWLSDASAACLVAILGLHIFGARWIYSYVPYDAWFRAALGSSPAEWFSWRRNYYDRFVHLAFGTLMVLPLVEAARRYGGASQRLSVVLALAAIAGLSAVYEVFEWLLAFIAAPEIADRYNGQQGDAWDAQKDMALSLVGSTAAAAGFTGPFCRRFTGLRPRAL